jgi:putative peptidoglycan lipid II flippase
LSSNKRIAQATFIVVLLNVASKLMGFVREQMIAVFYGATATTDAYVIANRIPTMITGFLSGPLSIAFLPVFAAHIARGDVKQANRVASSIITLSALLVLVVSLAALAPAPAIVKAIAPGFSGTTLANAVMLTRIFFPAMIFPLLAAYAKSVLNTYDEFTVPAIAPALQNLVIIAIVALFAPAFGIAALAAGVIAGYVAGLIVQLPTWRKKGSWPSFSLHLDESTRKVFVLSLPLLASTLFSQVYMLVEGNLGSRLPEGSIAALSFADRVRQVPVGLFVAAVTTVIYPSLSAMWARNDKDRFKDTVITGMRYVGFICIPAAVGLMVLAEPVIRLAFRYGAFTPEAAVKTASALLAYAPGLVAISTSQVIGIAFYSGHETRIPVALGVATSVLNAVLAVVLVGPMAHVGLALANSIASATGALVALYVLSRYLGGLPMRTLSVSMAKILGASLAMGAAVFLLGRVTGFSAGAGSFVANVLAGMLTIGGGVAVYLVLALVLRCEELTMFLGLAKDKIGSLSKKVR